MIQAKFQFALNDKLKTTHLIKGPSIALWLNVNIVVAGQ